MSKQIYNREKLLKLAAWAQLAPKKTAFIDPSGGMPPAGAAPMDPAMAGAMPPGAAPMDPAMAGAMPPGIPPQDPMMPPGGLPAGDPMMAMPGPVPPPAPPADPSVQEMGNQESIRNIIRDEIKNALGGGEGGTVPGGGQKKGNKIEELYQMLESMREQSKEDKKIFIAALRSAGIEIPLGDIYALDSNQGSGSPAQEQGPSQPGISETLNPGLGSETPGSQPGKIAAVDSQMEMLTRLARTRDNLNRSALASKMSPPYEVQQSDLNYLAGLFR